MVVRLEPKVAPSDVMQIIKSISARKFFKLRPEIKKKYFWGGKLWTQSYFVETIGNLDCSKLGRLRPSSLSKGGKLTTRVRS